MVVVKEILCKTILSRSKIYGVDYSVNPYVGCQHACVYCVHPQTKILTEKGLLRISDMVDKYFEDDKQEGVIAGNFGSAVTHKGELHEISAIMRHRYLGKVLRLKMRYFGNVVLTPSHRVYAVKRNEVLCHSNSTIVCYPNRERVSLRDRVILCKSCQHQKSVSPTLTPVKELSEGDFLMVPIPKITKNIEEIDSAKVLEAFVQSARHKGGKNRMLPLKTILKIRNLHKKGINKSQIARMLNISRPTVYKYIEKGISHSSPVLILFKDNKICFSNSKKGGILQKIHLTTNFLRLSGYYLSEGCVHKPKNRVTTRYVSFVFNKEEKQYINDTVNLIKKVFNLEPSIVPVQKDNTVHITFSNAECGVLFEELFGATSKEKRMPSTFLYLPIEKQKAILEGLLKGDGCRSRFSLDTCSRELTEQFSILLLRLGFLHSISISTKDRESDAFSIKPQMHDSNMTEFLRLFGEKENIRIPRKHNPHFFGDITNDFAIVPIKKIESEEYSGFVYNLTIKKDNSYTANFIAISNCYARFMARGTHRGAEWGSFVDVKVNALKLLASELRRKPRGLVMLSSVTDPYQPLEKKYELTRGVLQRLSKHGFPASVLTKSELVVRDLDVIKGMKDCEVGLTITTLDEDVKRVFEPWATSVEGRLDALQRLREAGVETYAFLGPMLPYLSEDRLCELLDKLCEVGVNRVLVDRLNLKAGNWRSIRAALDKNFPDFRVKFEEVLFKPSEYYERLKLKISEMCRRRGLRVDSCY